ncbi:MAG: alpha/beta fold hydrolase [Bacteroidales bacterium]
MEKTSAMVEGIPLAYNDRGSGKPLVLLHGFMESSEIWDEYATELSETSRVITPDLPGHGSSGMMGTVHRMDEMAMLIYRLLQHLNALPCTLVGHSMGGYVALELAAHHPEAIEALCLFHSNAHEDSPEAIINRNRTISLVHQNRKGFISQFIPELFAPDNRLKFANEIRLLQDRAAGMTSESIIASLEGMKIRRNHYDTLRNLQIPVLQIIGMKDSRADLGKMQEQALLPAISMALYLRECGHMGYLEAREECFRVVESLKAKG